jgi:hypothetical protein
VVAEDFHYRSVDRRLGQREHLLETCIYESDLHVAIGDQNTLYHAGKDSAQAEILVREVSRILSLLARDLLQAVMNFLHDAGIRNSMRKCSICKQAPDFAAQEQKAPPKSDGYQAENAEQDQPDNQPPDYHTV